MAKTIFFVGRPYPKAYALPAFGGYKLGILLDKNITVPDLDKYDEVIEVDFSSPKSFLGPLVERGARIDGLVCTYENYILAKSRIAAALGLPAPSIGSAEKCTDKLLMRQAFQLADPEITPRFGAVQTEEEALRLAEELSYPIIIKPANLVKSLLVLKCENEAELLRNLAYAQQKLQELYQRYRVYGRRPQLIIEEYIEGRICSIAAFVDKEGEPHFCDGMVSLANAQDINVNDNFIYRRTLPGDFDDKLSEKLFEVAAKGIKALQMASTPAHVEIVYNDEQVKLIEIGARIGGYRPRMYSVSYGIDLISQEVKIALGEKPDLSGKLTDYCAVFELFPAAEGHFNDIKGDFDPAGFTYFSVKAKPGAMVGPAKNGYKAAAVIIVASPDKGIFEHLCNKVDGLEVSLR
jgi:biotin carboxylase